MGTKYHHGNLQATLLEEAIELVREGGPQALTVRAVAGRARVTHPAVYRHFGSRIDLLAAVATEALLSLARHLEEAVRLAGEGSLQNAILAIVRAYVRWGIADREAFRVAFSSEVWDKSTRPALRSAADRAAAPLLHHARLWTSDASDARALSLAIWAQAHGAVVLALDHQLEQGELSLVESTAAATADLTTRAVDSLLVGWRSRDQGQ